ncbi:MAG TPA: hypothetical protein VLA72_22460 [Anaerolineales bacterium]|nr:hypothetical protein [Anaerolineales bacterium]
MRIAYLTYLYPPIANTSEILTPQTTKAMANRGHQILIIAASDREYSYHIYRDNVTIVQLNSFKCPFFIGEQPLFLPFPIILKTLYNFRPDIIYMDRASSMNWIGHVYSFFLNIPTKPTPTHQGHPT